MVICKQLKLITFILIISLSNLYSKSLAFKGIAKKDGKLLYTEKHHVTYKESKMISAYTTYERDGEDFLKIENNFKNGYAIPEYKVTPLKKGRIVGVKYVGNKPYMYRGNEKELIESSQKLIIAGQGIHYYLLNNLQKIAKQKKTTFKFFIEEEFTSFTFRYVLKKQEGDKLFFRVEIDSWFLRLFAPHFDIIYNQKLQRIVYYKGLTNIKDKDGDPQNVEITYKY